MRQLRGHHGRRVLLVDDESRLRDMLLTGTREMGFDPVACGSAEQAIRLMEQEPAPVVVIDLNLPGAGGIELLQAIRNLWPATQAIILTGFGELQSARQAIRLDVVDFLTKPCALGDLEIALGRAFRRLEQVSPATLDPKIEVEEQTACDADQARGEMLTFAPRDGSAALSMEEVERNAIVAALQKHNGNRAATAAELGISLRKLYYRLGEYQKKGFIS